MSDFQQAMLLSTLAALAIPIGGAAAAVSRIHPKWLETGARHAIMAFGGGALFSAVALVLIPEGVAELSMVAASLCFAAGGFSFYLLERILDRTGGAGAQLVAMLSDFVPEAVALGAALATAKPTATVLACMIALQNLPEGFNAQRELEERSSSSNHPPWLFAPLVLLGPVSAAIGFYWLADQPALLGGLMVFAGGGILYLVFQDIAPDSRLEDRSGPALGAVLGFLLGLMGYLVVKG